MTRKTRTTVVAEICLYGGTYGAGWLATTADGRMFGDGEPREGRTLTSAVFLACRELCEQGIDTGLVEVYEPQGQLVAKTIVSNPCYYGRLDWQPAKQYVLTAAAILAASGKNSR